MPRGLKQERLQSARWLSLGRCLSFTRKNGLPPLQACRAKCPCPEWCIRRLRGPLRLRVRGTEAPREEQHLRRAAPTPRDARVPPIPKPRQGH
eukprot:1116925-Alexandrium_andersonii.AAC.1